MRIPKSQISGTSSYSSSSVISEPPDIKQWFSSYTYQSPELDTNEKDMCLSHGVDEERGLCVEDNETEEEENGEDLSKRDHSINCKSTEEAREHEDLSLPNVEVPAYLDSLSMPSEPPDIANWFSSYVYESPELDSADIAVSLSSDCTFGKKREVDEGRKDHIKELPVIKVKDEILSCTNTILRSTELENNKKPSTVADKCSERSNLLPEHDFCFARTYDETIFRVKLNNCNKNPDKSFDNPRIKSIGILPSVKEEQYIRNKDHLRSPTKTTFSPGGFIEMSEEKKTEKKCMPDESDSGWISLNCKPKEENQVTFMKNKVRPRANKENSPVKSVNSCIRQKEGMLRREILKEMTNFDHFRVPEISGKWRCPQKYKPDTGPPMKQLRLEKWFHR